MMMAPCREVLRRHARFERRTVRWRLPRLRPAPRAWIIVAALLAFCGVGLGDHVAAQPPGTPAASAAPAGDGAFAHLAWSESMMAGLRAAEEGRPADAIDAFSRALELTRAADRTQPFLAATLNNLGRASALARRADDAERYLRRALAVASTLPDGDASGASTIVLHNLHAHLLAEGRDAEAERLLAEREVTSILLARRLADVVPGGRAPGGSSLFLVAPSVRYAVRKVFLATDRRPLLEPRPHAAYSTRRGELSFGVATVSIPLDARIGRLRNPSWMRLEFGYDPERHVTLLDIAPDDEARFLARIRAELERAPRRDVLLYVHGFNESLENATRLAAQLAWDLKYEGLIVVYSWPSRNVLSTEAYLTDRQNAEWTVPHLARTIEALSAAAGSGSVCVVAHSLGSQPLLGALEELVVKRGPGAPPLCREVIFVAPDVDADVFRRRIARVRPAALRHTVYVSSNDRALQYSRDLHGDLARAGDSGRGIVVVDGIDTVEVSDVDTSLLGHSYHNRNRSVLSDIYYLVTTGAGPDKRHGLVPLRDAGGRYWKFRP